MIQKCFLLLFTLCFASVITMAQRNDRRINARNSESGQFINVRASLYFTEADNALMQGDLIRAEQAIDKAIAVDPYFAEAYLKKALLYYRLNKQTQADEAYRTAQRLNPYVASVYGLQGQQEQLSVMAIEPEKLMVPPATYALYGYYKQQYYERFDSSQYTDPSYLQLSELFWQAVYHNEFIGAQAYLYQMKAIYSDIQFPDIYALAEWEFGDTEAAHTLFLQQLEKYPNDPAILYHLSKMAMQQDKNEEAFKLINKAIQYHPDFAPAYFLRSSLFKYAGEHNKSLKDLQKYQQYTESNSFSFLVNRSLARKLTGDAIGALDDINLAIETAEQPEARLYKIRGNLYVLLGQYWSALRDYDEAIKLTPDNPQIYHNRAIAHLLMYNRADACFNFRKAEQMGYNKAKEFQAYFCVQ